jgi:hypothetical protein
MLVLQNMRKVYREFEPDSVLNLRVFPSLWTVIAWRTNPETFGQDIVALKRRRAFTSSSQLLVVRAKLPALFDLRQRSQER